MASETELLRLALLAYEAAMSPELWGGFLKRYMELVSADGAMLQVHDLAAHASVILSAFGITSPLKKSYNEYFSKLNLWRERGGSLYVAGRVNLDHEQCTRSELERSEFYNDCLKRFGIAYSMGAVLAREGESAPTITSLRGPGKRAFEETERRIAHFLSPHLSRAWTIAKHLDTIEAGESALDSLPVGAVFVASNGNILYCNRTAGEILRSNDGISVRHGMLSPSNRRTEVQFRKLIASALPGCEAPGSAAIAIPRPSLRRDYQVAVAPLTGRLRPFAGMTRPEVLVLINDPEPRQASGMQALMHLYKLTRKETALAAKLSEGKTLKDAAGELSITYETARTHLRRIFSKTGTARQSEFLLLIARLPVAGDGNGRG